MPAYTITFPTEAVSAIKAAVPDEDQDGLTDKGVVLLWLDQQLRKPLSRFVHSTDIAPAIEAEQAARVMAEDALATEQVALKAAEEVASLRAAGIVVS